VTWKTFTPHPWTRHDSKAAADLNCLLPQTSVASTGSVNLVAPARATGETLNTKILPTAPAAAVPSRFAAISERVTGFAFSDSLSHTKTEPLTRAVAERAPVALQRPGVQLAAPPPIPLSVRSTWRRSFREAIQGHLRCFSERGSLASLGNAGEAIGRDGAHFETTPRPHHHAFSAHQRHGPLWRNASFRTAPHPLRFRPGKRPDLRRREEVVEVLRADLHADGQGCAPEGEGTHADAGLGSGDAAPWPWPQSYPGKVAAIVQAGLKVQRFQPGGR
jgi:hypothetical protein